MSVLSLYHKDIRLPQEIIEYGRIVYDSFCKDNYNNYFNMRVKYDKMVDDWYSRQKKLERILR